MNEGDVAVAIEIKHIAEVFKRKLLDLPSDVEEIKKREYLEGDGGEMTKTCATCKWVRCKGEFSECAAPSNFDLRKPYLAINQQTHDLVGVGGTEEEAKPHARWIFCLAQRSGSAFGAWMTNSCGPQGRWWEAVEQAKTEEHP